MAAQHEQETSGVSLGTFLRGLRELRGLSVERLSFAAGVAPSTLRRWEGGKFQPRLPELRAVLAAVQATPQEQARAFALLNAPRAVAGLRAVTEDQARSEELHE